MKSRSFVRRLGPSDVEACVQLRREMLIESPHAFLASPDDDRGSDVVQVRARLASDDPHNVTFGAFASGLVGSVGVVRESHQKARHKALIWGMYVSPRCRGEGLGRALMESAIEHARELGGVTQIQLCVSELSTQAKALYETLGFRTWGVERAAMIIDGQALDEHHMTLELA